MNGHHVLEPVELGQGQGQDHALILHLATEVLTALRAPFCLKQLPALKTLVPVCKYNLSESHEVFFPWEHRFLYVLYKLNSITVTVLASDFIKVLTAQTLSDNIKVRFLEFRMLHNFANLFLKCRKALFTRK